MRYKNLSMDEQTDVANLHLNFNSLLSRAKNRLIDIIEEGLRKYRVYPDKVIVDLFSVDVYSRIFILDQSEHSVKFRISSTAFGVGNDEAESLKDVEIKISRNEIPEGGGCLKRSLLESFRPEWLLDAFG